VDIILPNPASYLSDTGILRVSECPHPVQGSGSDSNLGRRGPVGSRSKGIAAYTFISPIDPRPWPQIVAAGFLPDHAALVHGSAVLLQLCAADLVG
jgi:hypothetical protein